jgi:hypothetical protein
MPYIVRMISSDGPVPLRKANTIQEAQNIVTEHLVAGWRGLTAEVINDDGEVVAYLGR